MTVLKDGALEGERVRLTRLQIKNIYQHFEWNNDPELNRLDSEVPFEEETFGDFKRRFEALVYQPPQHGLDFEVYTEAYGLIGVGYIAQVSEHNRHAVVGVTIGNRDAWGQGYGREALELILRHCFDDLGLHRVSTETFEYNDAWKRLVKTAGFRCEGVERDYLYREGRFWDKEVYALLEEEYRDRPPAPDPSEHPTTDEPKPIAA